MPIISKTEHKKLKNELSHRISRLYNALESRPLTSNTEGCNKRQHWAVPEAWCATLGSTSDLRLVVEDLKLILAEIKRLK